MWDSSKYRPWESGSELNGRRCNFPSGEPPVNSGGQHLQPVRHAKDATLPPWRELQHAAHHAGDPLPVLRLGRELLSAALGDGVEFRQRRADGVYRWFQSRTLPARDTEGRITGWYMLLTDIDDRKRAEEKLRQDEWELRQLIDFLPQHVLVLDAEGFLLQANQMVLDYNGYTLEEMQGAGTDARVKRDLDPDDLERVRSERRSRLSSGVPFEIEKRVLGKDGRYRWFLFRYRPLLDEQGRVARWFATATDIEDRKQAEQRVRNENLALREEIDRYSMYEAIVGSSVALRSVIAQIDKVAPTDSTVLIFGETGTGKELIASAIHKRSNRSARAFIRLIARQFQLR